MRVIIDERERDLYDKCDMITMSNLTYIQLEKEVLPLGDIFIKTDEGKDVAIIERKTLQDLLASIKDGRYEEQSYRLMHSSGFPPHSVIYIIEGLYSQLRTTMERKIVYSAITSLNFFKGFSVIRTANVTETAEHIIWTAEKIEKNFGKGIFPYYLKPECCKYLKMPKNDENRVIDNIEDINEENVVKPLVAIDTITEQSNENVFIANKSMHSGGEPENYCTVVKKVKKDNITPENIGEIILCQMPGISAVTAIAIMKKFSGFRHFMQEIQKDSTCLENIVYESNGKTRKIGKNCIDNIKKYLL